MCDRLVERVLADADRREAQVELADVDGVQRGVERVLAGMQDVLLLHGIVFETELADEVLRVDDVLDQPVLRMPAVGREEDVAVRSFDVGATAEHRHHAGQVSVADVVLAAGRGEAAVVRGREHHVRRVDVRAVLFLGEAEREDRAVVEQIGRAPPGGGVLALPDRAESEDRDLPRVPVRQAVEAGDLAERGDARGVPALVRIAAGFGRGGQHGREDPLALDELQEVRVPGALVILLLERRLAAGLEELDRRQQCAPGRLVEFLGAVGARIEERARRDG